MSKSRTAATAARTSQTAAPVTNTPAPVKATVKATEPVVKPFPLCEDDCGHPTKGGRFIPGHDAKLKSRLINAALGGNVEARQQLEKLGWLQHLALSQSRFDREAGRVQARIAKLQAQAAKLGVTIG